MIQETTKKNSKLVFCVINFLVLKNTIHSSEYLRMGNVKLDKKDSVFLIQCTLILPFQRVGFGSRRVSPRRGGGRSPGHLRRPAQQSLQNPAQNTAHNLICLRVTLTHYLQYTS